MMSDPVQSVLQSSNIPLQTMFSQYAHPREGTLSYDNLKQMLRQCDIDANSNAVVGAIAGAFGSMVAHDPAAAGLRLFFPELLELLARVADANSGAAADDLADSLSQLLHTAWSTFAERVPGAMQVASAIAASHQAATANALGDTPRETKVKFG